MPSSILIIDDQVDLLDVLDREFERLTSFKIFCTATTDQARAAITKNKIDLVISDVRIGSDSGLEFVRELRSQFPSLGVVLMTAYRSAATRQQAAELGVNLFLEKPFSITKLIEEVKAFFSKSLEPKAEVAQPNYELNRLLSETNNIVPSETLTSLSESHPLFHFKPQDLVQIFCLNGRNVSLMVGCHDSGAEGEIHISKGRVLHASYLGYSGEQAFYQMMLIPTPSLRIQEMKVTPPMTITASWEQLLLSSAVHKDESRPH